MTIPTDIRAIVKDVQDTSDAAKRAAFPRLTANKPDSADKFWLLAVGVLPKQNNAVTFRTVGGPRPHPSLLLDFPRLQIYGRGDKFIDTEEVMEEIKNVLLGREAETTAGGHWLAAVNIMSDTMFIGEDMNGRFEFTTNYALIVEPHDTGFTNREPLPRVG